MRLAKVRDGLWRWTAPHPAWKPENDRPDGWAQEVGSVFLEGPAGIVVFDPLVPAAPDDAEMFWAALDRDVDRAGGDLTVLVGCVDHGRSADAVRARYAARGIRVAVIGAAAIRDGVSCRLTATLDEAGPPPGVEAHAVAGFIPGETAWVLPGPRAIVFADAVLGTGGGRVRLAPASWAVRTPEGQEAYAREFAPSIARLLASGPEVLLPSHGDPVLSGGAAALAAAIAEASGRA